jgi:RNA polymerase sigma factor (sigma-70 family)
VDDGARDDLVLENTGWARSLALLTLRKYRLRIDADEAIAAAYLALVDTASRFKRGGPDFRPFAAHRVRGAVLDLAYKDNVNGRTPQGRRRFRAPPLDLAELADRLRDPSPGPLGVTIAREAIRLFGLARPREQLVLWLHHVEGLTLAEIAQRLGVTESRACQIAREGVARIREAIGPVT